MNAGNASASMKLGSFLLAITLLKCSFNSVSATSCEYSLIHDGKLYNYSLASPIPNYPHGVLSEDGFYKVAGNDTVLWFQLCDGMIFNHDPPRCADCSDCGGSSRCGTGCNAIMASIIEGYFVCDTIGVDSSSAITAIDGKRPDMGVIVKLSSIRGRLNCSLSVSVLCDSNGLQSPESLQKLGACDYATVLPHPAGCAMIVSVRGKGWGWFGTLLAILLCLLGAYLLAGVVYRSFFLGIRGQDVIPNLDFWTSIAHRTQSFFVSLAQKFQGPAHHHRSSYSPVNF